MDITLTDAQKAQFPAYLDKWLKIGFTTGPALRDKAEEGVRLAYAEAGFPLPKKTIWLGSPFAGALFDTAIAFLKDSSKSTPAERGDIPSSARPILESVQSVLAEVDPKQVPSLDLLWSLAHSLNLRNVSYGQHDAAILCFYDFFAEVCNIEECRKLDGLNRIAQSSGWWWAYDKAVVLTERPVKLALDDRGNFHNETDWALLYPDGFGICSVHGVTVPPWIILEPTSISVQHIEAEQNVEIRRIMLNKYGWGKYLLDSGAEQIHADDWGTLYRKEVKEDEPLVMVKVVNSTLDPDQKFHDYLIRVPPTITRAKEAVSWHLDTPENEYLPNAET